MKPVMSTQVQSLVVKIKRILWIRVSYKNQKKGGNQGPESATKKDSWAGVLQGGEA